MSLHKSDSHSVDSLSNAQGFRRELLADYKLMCLSREASLLGRKEVLGGKAKFGIFGDGKELAQIALSKVLRPGDWRSGYYRDQTLMMAQGLLTVKQYFAALYADTDKEREPMSAGRQMGGHFATCFVDDSGAWMDQMAQFNSSADLSPTAAQMPRLLGLAQASKLYRALPNTAKAKALFTNSGDEIAIGTIGDSSTSQGAFWETMNAACVLQVPILMSVWDDGYGISVPKEFQTTKASISLALSGMEMEQGTNGMLIFRVNGWDYPALVATYEAAEKECRERHVPVLVHVEELTQPQGHSTSGSHERYKSSERMEWAKQYDCLVQFEQFLTMEGAASVSELEEIRTQAKKEVRTDQKEAWQAFRVSIDEELNVACGLLDALMGSEDESLVRLRSAMDPGRADVHAAVRKALHETVRAPSAAREALLLWSKSYATVNADRYSAHLYSSSSDAVTQVRSLSVSYAPDAPVVDGRQVLQKNFEALFERIPELVTFGEDTGKIGGVNQVMEGMQEQFGQIRVADTGIRECTIAGQGIGLAMRGFRPIAEIQYLDYLYYALQILRDDAASVRYRSAGGQKTPVIIRTRGHRLEGIWHSGSPMGAIIHSLRGMIVCVPRNMTEAAGMYNTLLEAEEPALVVECLNGYRSKERLPENLGDFRMPIGIPEVVRVGNDITLLSYGSTFEIAEQACVELEQLGVDIELIDARTLLPFDRTNICVASVAKTNRLLIVDEDVPGGASAYLLDQILNEQDAWKHLDDLPRTLTARPHLPPYGSDGDYYAKPNLADIVEAAYDLMHRSDPVQFPLMGA